MRLGEIACNKQFLLFSQCSLPYMVLIFHFKCTLKMSSAICFNLDQCKILVMGYSKLKAFPDNKMSMTRKLKFDLGMVENIVGKGENAGYQHFLHYPQCF